MCRLSYPEQAYVETHSFHMQALIHFEKQKLISKAVFVGLENLVLTYGDAIIGGDLPCTENAILALAQVENVAAVQKAIVHHDKQMGNINTSIKLAISALNFTSKKKGISVERRDQEEKYGPAEVPVSCSRGHRL